MRPKRKFALITVRMTDCDLILSPEYQYVDGSARQGPVRRMRIGESLSGCAAELWEFVFSKLLEMQSEAPEVALEKPQFDGRGWASVLCEGFILAVAWELKIQVLEPLCVEAEQLELLWSVD